MQRYQQFAVFSLLSCLCACPGPTTKSEVGSVRHDGHATREKPALRYDANTFHETVSLSRATFSHDETQILLGMDTTGIYNAYSLPVSKGEATQLTHSDTESLFPLSYFPGDNRFLYTADSGGNEDTHIFVSQPDGAAVDLTPGDKVKASFLDWSADGKHFWLTTNERDRRAFDVYRYATDGYARELLFQNDQALTISDVSKDGRWLALTKVNGNTDSDIYLWDAQSKAAPALISAHEGAIRHQAQEFTPDSAQLVYVTNANSEFDQAWLHDLKSGEKTLLARAEWDVMAVRHSPNGTYRMVYTNEDARTVVRIQKTATGEQLTLPPLPAGDVSGGRFSRSEKLLALSISRDRASRDLYLLNLADNSLNQLTSTMNTAIDPEQLVDGQVIRYKSFDGLEIPAILYRPKGASATAPVPALVWVHGGPGGQSRLGYRATLQHIVNHGYALLAVNNRGSSGYGKTFFHLDDRKHGEADLDDCVWAHKYLAGMDWVDKERIGIIGGSYGGFMVAAALTFRPDVFAVGVDIFGVTNWLRTLTNIPPYWAAFAQQLYDEMGDPKTDSERLRRISPLFHAANIKKPLMVIQGANDPRVVKAESDDLVAAARKNGAPVEYLVFDDEGHGFRKRKNRIMASQSMVKFLDTHLRGQQK